MKPVEPTQKWLVVQKAQMDSIYSREIQVFVLLPALLQSTDQDFLKRDVVMDNDNHAHSESGNTQSGSFVVWG